MVLLNVKNGYRAVEILFMLRLRAYDAALSANRLFQQTARHFDNLVSAARMTWRILCILSRETS